MKLVWTRFAVGNLQAIYDHIAQTSNDYARSMIQRITSRSSQIEAFPFPDELCLSSRLTRFEKSLHIHIGLFIAFDPTELMS